MDRLRRAKQFAPFEPLRGLREALEEKEREAARIDIWPPPDDTPPKERAEQDP